MWGSLKPWGSLSPWGSLGTAGEPEYEPRTLREALYARLSTGLAIAAIVGDRIHPGGLPQDCPLPAITYAVAGGLEPRTLRRSTRYRTSRVRISAWSSRESEAAELIQDVRSRIVDFRGWIGLIHIGSVGVENEMDLPERPAEGEGDWTYQVVLDLRVWHRGGSHG